MAENSEQSQQTAEQEESAILDFIVNQKTPEPVIEEQSKDNPETQQTNNEQSQQQQTDPNSPEVKQTEPQNTNWIAEASKIAGVEVKSEEEVKDYFEKAKNYTGLQSELDNLKHEHESLKGQPEPFADDYIKKLNDMRKQGRSKEDIAAFEKVNSVGELKELSPLETVKLALQLRDGLTAEEADIRIKSRYKLDEEVYEKDIVDADKVNLKLDAKKDAEFLEQFRVEISEDKTAKTKEEQEKDFAKQIADYTEKVRPIAKSIQEKFTEIKGINLNGKTGDEAHIINLPVPEDMQQHIADLAERYAIQYNIPLNEEGIKNINEFVENTLWVQNRQNIAIHIASETERRVRAEFDNPASISRGQDRPADPNAVSEKQTEDFMING